MARKINAKGFRFGIYENYNSKWHEFKNYNILISKDLLIRKYIENLFSNFIILDDIIIERISNIIDNSIIIHINTLILQPQDFITNYLNKIINKRKNILLNELIYKNKFLDTLNNDLLFILENDFGNQIKFFIYKKFNQLCDIKFNIFTDPYLNAKFITQMIGNLLKKRIATKIIFQQVFSMIDKTKIKGLKIKLSGRLDGVEMAKTEWKQYGVLPLNTLNSKIDYSYSPLLTIYGLIGIKVWLLKI